MSSSSCAHAGLAQTIVTTPSRSSLTSVTAAILGVYMAGVRIVEFFTRRILVQDGVEAIH